MVSEIKDGEKYYILNLGGRLVLDLDSGSSISGTNVHGWSPGFDSKNPQRVWKLEAGGDHWIVRNVMSGTVMALKNGDSDNGTPIVGEKPDNADRQKWRIYLTEPESLCSYWT